VIESDFKILRFQEQHVVSSSSPIRKGGLACPEVSFIDMPFPADGSLALTEPLEKLG
jgi:hypothetical protein